jgi:metal-responsive CopG/Arc/MetJ family transcriptional regulator
MKVKTSITISSELLSELDAITTDGTRSEFIEKAIRGYLELLGKDLRDKKDLRILNSESESLNSEAIDVLSYQAPL